MPIELAGIRLERIHKVAALEQAAFVHHRIPGLEGNIVQEMGRDSVRLQIEGIFYGPNAKDDLATLRTAYKKREPVDFLAEIIGQAYFAQVMIEGFQVLQQAREPEQFGFVLAVAEFVPPPEPEAAPTLSVDNDIVEQAQTFMDIAALPDLLTLPEFSDPISPLSSLLDGVKTSLSGLDGTANDLTALFG